MDELIFRKVFKLHCKKFHETWTDYDIDMEATALLKEAKKCNKAAVIKSVCDECIKKQEYIDKLEDILNKLESGEP